jgi:hypothetical protein
MTVTENSASPKISYRRILIDNLWILIPALILYIAFLPSRYVGYYADDSNFVLLAKSLLQGHYVTLYAPGTPPPNVHFLPGYPIFLMPFVAVMGAHIAWLKFTSIALCLLAILLFQHLASFFLAPAWKKTGTILFALHPVTACCSVIVMSDTFFMFLILLIFVGLGQVLTDPQTRWSPWMIGLLTGWACLVRPIGIILIPCVALGFVSDRLIRQAINIILIALAILLPVLIRNHFAAHTVVDYLDFWKSEFIYLLNSPQTLFTSWDQFTHTFFIDGLLGLTFLTRTAWRVHLFRGIIAALLFCLGYGAVKLKNETAGKTSNAMRTSISCFCLFYMGVHTFWTTVDIRYVLPLLPFFILLILVALEKEGPSRTFFKAGGFLCVLWIALVLNCDRRALKQIYSATYPARNFYPRQSFDWIKNNTPVDSIFLASGPTVFLYTQRKCIDQAPASDAENLRYALSQQGVHYIVIQDILLLSVKTMNEMDQQRIRERLLRELQMWPEAFKPIYLNEREHILIFQVAFDATFQKAYEYYSAALKESQESLKLEKLNIALKLYPRFPSALNALGVTQLSRGDAVSAQATLLRASHLQPENALILLNLSRAYQELKEGSQAKLFLEKARAEAQSSVLYSYLLPLLNK